MSDPTNDSRADSAQAAVKAFQKVTRTDDEDAVADLIANLLHLAVRQGLDPQLMLDRAQSNFEAERAEEAPSPSSP